MRARGGCACGTLRCALRRPAPRAVDVAGRVEVPLMRDVTVHGSLFTWSWCCVSLTLVNGMCDGTLGRHRSASTRTLSNERAIPHLNARLYFLPCRLLSVRFAAHLPQSGKKEFSLGTWLSVNEVIRLMIELIDH